MKQSETRGKLKKRVQLVFNLVLGLWFISLVLYFSYPESVQPLFLPVLSKTKAIMKRTFQASRVCVDEKTHAWQMNDPLSSYWSHSKETGIQQQLRYIRDIRKAFYKGEIELVESNDYYEVDTMWYSYAFAKAHVKDFLDTLGDRFQRHLQHTDLEGARFVITSLLRTEHSIQRLQKRNRNAIKQSTHLHGTTFDVSYAQFSASHELTEGEIQHLKEALAHSLFDLRNENKCWVKYELYQTCFHVVCKQADFTSSLQKASF